MSFQEMWPTADPDAVGGGMNDLVPPADGKHVVTLVEAGAWVAKSGKETVRLRFQTCDAARYEWVVLYGFKSQQQANLTKREIRALGIDVDSLVSLEMVDQALQSVTGKWFEIEVVRDRFENTYILGPVTEAPPVAARAAPAAAPVPDDDIPF